MFSWTGPGTLGDCPMPTYLFSGLRPTVCPGAQCSFHLLSAPPCSVCVTHFFLRDTLQASVGQHPYLCPSRFHNGVLCRGSSCSRDCGLLGGAGIYVAVPTYCAECFMSVLLEFMRVRRVLVGARWHIRAACLWELLHTPRAPGTGLAFVPLFTSLSFSKRCLKCCRKSKAF